MIILLAVVILTSLSVIKTSAQLPYHLWLVVLQQDDKMIQYECQPYCTSRAVCTIEGDIITVTY